MKSAKAPQFSKTIGDFCKMVDMAKKDYEQSQLAVAEMDRLTQDYLHDLELGGLNYESRAKIATKLAECRKIRRIAKDRVSVLEPFVTLVDGEQGKRVINQMREVLGKTRKVEESMNNRTYRYRVLDDSKNR